MIDREALMKLRPLLDSPLWDAFEKIVEMEIAYEHTTLERANDVPTIHRSQGRLQVLKDFANLRTLAKRPLEVE